MPYLFEIYSQSPFVPKGLEVLDDWSGLNRPPPRISGDFVVSMISSGLPFEPEIVPRRFSVDLPADALPEIISLRFAFGVTDRFRQKVEDLEPGVHQFFEVEISAKGGEQPKHRYWFLNICNRVDAIDQELTTLPLVHDGLLYSTEGLSVGDELGLVFRKEAVAGKCMWIDRRVIGTFFFSDELVAFVEENQLTETRTWKVRCV